MKIKNIAVILILAPAICIAAPAADGKPGVEFDADVRGSTPADLWVKLSPSLKHVRCLKSRISSIRRLISRVAGINELLDAYPSWERSLEWCAQEYPIPTKRAAQLREAVATQMATALGIETSSFLTMRRLYADEPSSKSLDRWQAFAITTIADVANVLPKEAK